MTIAQDLQLAGVFRRGLASFESLEPDEKIQFTLVLAQPVTNSENSFNDNRAGIKSNAAFERD